MASTTRQRFSIFRRKETEEDPWTRLPSGDSPVLVRLVIFFGILSIASGAWACRQAVTPFALVGASLIYKMPGKLLLFSGSMLIITGLVTILKASDLIRVAILSLLSSLNAILIVETVAGASAFAMSSVVTLGSLNESLLQDLKQDYSKDRRITSALDEIHATLHCCGIRGPDDWLESYWARKNDYNSSWYPTSCCGKVDPCSNSTNSFQKVV